MIDLIAAFGLTAAAMTGTALERQKKAYR